MELTDFLNLRLTANDGLTFRASSRQDVTVLTYFYRSEADYASKFDSHKEAIRETWRHCGLMKTVVVTNHAHKCVEAFAARYSPWVEIQVEPWLEPGTIKPLSIDSIRNLHARFDTAYVLTVQDDGFPVRPGWGGGGADCDYIGAPFNASDSRIDFYHYTYPRLCVGNGGFSLRTKRICELASWHYRRFYKILPFNWLLYDDIFYCRTLPFFSRSYRRSVRFATPEEASRFSLETNLDFHTDGYHPFGFHSRRAFRNLTQKGILQV